MGALGMSYSWAASAQPSTDLGTFLATKNTFFPFNKSIQFAHFDFLCRLITSSNEMHQMSASSVASFFQRKLQKYKEEIWEIV